MRLRRSACGTSTCPSPPIASGKPSRRRRLAKDASRMDFGLTDLQRDVQRETRAIAARFGLNYWREHDRDAAYPWEFVQAYADAGWLGVVIPEAYGGAGLGLTEAGLLLHEVGRSGAGTSGASAVHFYIFPLTPVIRHGSEYLKSTFLPLAARGK